MTTAQDPIAHAARLLREAAEELRQAHAYNRSEGWENETDAKAAYDEHMAAAQALEDWEAAIVAGGVSGPLVGKPQEMPYWMQYDERNDVLTINGKRYAAGMFGADGFLSPPGTWLRVCVGAEDCVTLSRASLAASPTPPAEQQATTTEAALEGVYAELPAPNLPRGGFPDLFTEGQMRDFADRTHALRMEQAAPKAAPGEPSAFPMTGDEEESDLGQWQPGTAKPNMDGTYLREFDEGEATSEFHQGVWLRDGFFPSDLQDVRWRGRTAPQPAPAPLSDDAKDAARYRWLRDEGFTFADVDLGTDSDGDDFVAYRIRFHLPEPAHSKFEDDEWTGPDIDAAIDAALAAQGGQ